jgi:DNA-binding beta-propeller fold protein YncE/cytochrome oxidase Cu insertion factor (SCO1/SenC/PrrC family)
MLSAVLAVGVVMWLLVGQVFHLTQLERRNVGRICNPSVAPCPVIFLRRGNGRIPNPSYVVDPYHYLNDVVPNLSACTSVKTWGVCVLPAQVASYNKWTVGPDAGRLANFVAGVNPMLSRLHAVALWLLRPGILASFFGAVLAAGIAFLMTTGAEAPANPAQGKRFDAPELVGGTDWLNTEKPIKLADLKGRIVVLDFWTLCCINCIHTLPDLARLEARYPNVLVVIGVHSPKFENEKKTSSIFKAILRYEITHPVVNDADHKIWDAYGVRSWPTLGLIDPEGKIVRGYSGEGNYDLLVRDIEKLIKDHKEKKTLVETPISFKLAKEKEVPPIYFPGKVLADAASKRIFIADSTYHRIVITNLEGKKIAIVGSGKEGLKDGKFADAQFSDPQGMVLDGEILYVADRKNHAIRAIDLKKETVKLVAGTGEQDRYGRGEGGDALKTGLNSPWDLLLFEGKIYVAMAGHHQIWGFDPAQSRVYPYAGNGREQLVDGPLSTSSFAQPSGLATDGKRLFVADSEISAIRSLPLPGVKGNVITIVGEGLFEFGDVNGKGDKVRLQHALGVAYLDGKLYVADTYNSKIKIIDPAQRTCDTYLGDPPGWLKAKMFDEPGGVSISGGKMYIADTNNHRIQVVDMKTKDVSTLKLEGVDPVRRDTKVEKK